MTIPKPPTSYEVRPSLGSQATELTIHKDDPMVEYEDEFGRIRTAKRSEVPRNLVLNQEDEVDEDEYVESPVC